MHVLNIIAIGHHTINIPEIFHVFKISHWLRFIDIVNRLSLLRVDKGKLTKIPDFFSVKSQEINSTEYKFYLRGFI